MVKEMCCECGKVFNAGPNAFLCQKCRKRRLSEQAKARGLSKIGHEAKSKKRREATEVQNGKSKLD